MVEACFQHFGCNAILVASTNLTIRQASGLTVYWRIKRNTYLVRLLGIEVLLSRRALMRHRAWVMLHWLWLHLTRVGRVLHGRVLQLRILVLAWRWLVLARRWLVLQGRVLLLRKAILVRTCKSLQESP